MELDCSMIAFPSEHMQLIDWILWLFSGLIVLFCCMLRNANDKFSVVDFWGLVIVKKGCGDSRCWYVLGT